MKTKQQNLIKYSLFIAIYFTVGLCTYIFPQEIVSEEDIQKAEIILEKTAANIQNSMGLEINFNMIHKQPNNSVEEMKGTAKIKNEKFKIELKDIEIISDGSTKWTYFPSSKEVQISSINPNNNEQHNPFSIFKDYKKHFKYHLIKEEQKNAIIRLVPINPKNFNFHTIKIAINTETYYPKNIEVMLKDRNTFIYQVTSLKKTINFPDSIFTFDINKANEVIDLR